MNNNLMLMIRLAGLQCDIQEFVYSKISNEDCKEFHKKMRRLQLMIDALDAGCEDFDWLYAHGGGWLCENDYHIFDELKGLKPEDWNK